MEDDLQLYGLKYNVVVMVFFITYGGLEVPCNVRPPLSSPQELDRADIFDSSCRSSSRCSVRPFGYLASWLPGELS
jgi:hypothetical protein